MDRTPLRIGFFSDTYRPYISGAVRSMELFADGLRARGHSVVIFAPTYPGYTGREPGVVRLPSLPLPGYPQLRLTLPLVETLTGQLSGFDLDIAHCHSPFAVGFLGLAVARQMEIPALFSCHSLYEEYVRAHMPWAPTSFRRLVRRYTVDFCNLTDAVAAPSAFTRDFLIDAGVMVPVKAVPTGIVITGADRDGGGARSDQGHVAEGRAHAGGDDGGDDGGEAELEMAATRESVRHSWTAAVGRHTRFLLFVGRVSKEKNLGFLVDALRELVVAGRDYYLIIVGDGPDRPRVAAHAEKSGLARRVVFTGALAPDQVQQFYRAADVFVFASPHETQGLVLLEAMANGLPVVAVDSPASAELTSGGQSGVLVPPDPGQMAAAVRRVADSSELAEGLVRRGRHRAAEFSTEAMTIHLENFYYDLIEQKSGQKPAQPDFSFLKILFSPR